LLEDFFHYVIGLKKIQRKGWKNKLGLEKPESVADHSYSMTMMAVILGQLQGLDIIKILKMSLIHDLAESIIGDYAPEEISKERKTNLENNAMNKILSKLPTNLIEEYTLIWQEYQAKKTNESEFIHEIDKLEMAFQAKTYMTEGHNSEQIHLFLDSAANNIKNKQLKQVFNKLNDN